VYSQLLDRENVAIIAKFALNRDPGVQFVIATTHLLYNPRRMDIRLAQVQILLAEIHRMAKPQDDNDADYLPIILSGDFNLQPYTAPYNLIVNGTLDYCNLSQKTLNAAGQSQNANQIQTNGRKLLPIKLGITDECQHVNRETKVMNRVFAEVMGE